MLCSACGVLGSVGSQDEESAYWNWHRRDIPFEPTETDRLLHIGQKLLGLWCDEEMVERWADCSSCSFPDGPGARAEDYLCVEHCTEAKKHNLHLHC